MKNYLLEMFEYDKTANILFADTLARMNNLPAECKQQLYHIGAVLQAWYDTAIEQESGIDEMFTEEPVDKSKQLIIHSTGKWIELIKSSSEEDLNKLITYESFDGKEYKNTIREIAVQVITHSIYHRGQINKLLGMNNLPAVKQDYIHYLRKNKTL